MIDVSIVIVCMNNLKNLYPCLESIRKYTNKVSYETLLVAYLFSEDNLKKLREDYPWVTIVESNEIRGFSENNNLALRQARGKYCFILNDDTYHSQSVIDQLVISFDSLPDYVAVLSPMILNIDGSIQRCGRPKYDLWTYTLDFLHLSRFCTSKYVNQEGIFETFNLSGACFMIRRDVFSKFGWFDERYFFCPEDVALSTNLNKLGYKCYVQSDIEMTHACGGTWSKTIRATKPASEKGCQLFYGKGSVWRCFYYTILSLFQNFVRWCYWKLFYLIKRNEHCRSMFIANSNAIHALLSLKTPKQLFVKYYEELLNEKKE